MVQTDGNGGAERNGNVSKEVDATKELVFLETRSGANAESVRNQTSEVLSLKHTANKSSKLNIILCYVLASDRSTKGTQYSLYHLFNFLCIR